MLAALPVAERLLRSGCLWNTFVMVCKADTFLEIATEALLWPPMPRHVFQIGVMSVFLQHGEAPLWAARWRIEQQGSAAQAESIAVA